MYQARAIDSSADASWPSRLRNCTVTPDNIIPGAYPTDDLVIPEVVAVPNPILPASYAARSLARTQAFRSLRDDADPEVYDTRRTFKPPLVVREDSGSSDQLRHDEPEDAANDNDDLLPNIKGLFRLLDLYTERGRGGLVDKIIIAQDSLKSLINSLLPGAYTSLTKIDFASLDRILIKVIGVYGSKSEIARVFTKAGATDAETTRLLLISQADRRPSHRSLRSGIYLFIPSLIETQHALSPHIAYVIYWPEDSTWDDKALGSAPRNRVTFMRYLTRLSDQIYALISPEHSSTLVWNDTAAQGVYDEEGQGAMGDGSDSKTTVDDRFFKFEVAKTHEQDENAQLHPGFEFYDPMLGAVLTVTSATTPLDTYPELVTSETRQGFRTCKVVGHGQIIRQPFYQVYTPLQLATELQHNIVGVEPGITEGALSILLNEGRLSTFTSVSAHYKTYLGELEELSRRNEIIKAQKFEEIRSNHNALRCGITQEVMNTLRSNFPTLDLDGPKQGAGSSQQKSTSFTYLASLCAMGPDVKNVLQTGLKAAQLEHVDCHDYKRLKKRYLTVQYLIYNGGNMAPVDQQDRLIRSIVSNAKLMRTTNNDQPKSPFSALYSMLLVANEEKKVEHFVQTMSANSDGQFLTWLLGSAAGNPRLFDTAQRLHSLARRWAFRVLESVCQSLILQMESAQRRSHGMVQVHAEQKNRVALFETFRRNVREALLSSGSEPSLVISSARRAARSTSPDLIVTGHHCELSEWDAEHQITLLELTEHDNVMLSANPWHVAEPQRPNHSICFHLPFDHPVRHLQLLRNDRYLLVVDSPTGATSIWLVSQHQPLPRIPTKQLPPGPPFVVAVDEKHRLIVFVRTDKASCVLHVFVMDETLTTLSGRGSPTDVSPWYPDGPPIIRTAVIFPGTEELCLVERSGRARIYSFLTQKFRHACIFLPAFDHVQAAPDASALLAISAAPIRKIGVYHRASFGAAKNDHQFILALPDVFSAGTSFTITSLGHRNISVLALVPSQQSICSVSLQISRQKTEYQFLTHTDRAASEGLAITESNCLIDCFAEVWRRYPVVPAMKRETISPNGKVGAAVTFVVEDAQKPFLQYFKFMIREFERVSRKPTDGRLDAIQIHTTAFRDLDWNGSEINSYKAGEWLVELVCLIPIHIAIAKENRFMPLKNGVLDQQFEQQLLGANVSRIIDSLSIGWYESILSSYMVTKPVRVISSMGEQSVGKSYSLNHITDSTFATSGVRTTEGVWLSVCPTRDTLVVALDFEGVQSIERTPQEDVLLILFNTALSNMVIFRNNFALSRDVANMFTSFQASARIFAPASNPGLFKGRLVVAIKDVVDRDSDEIVQEFKMKFSQIVGKEQANNFITNLHAGQLTVIPWNVIESREFYTLFSKLSKQLFKQKTTHASAGEFLMTLKTLMAKLKAQDWGAMDQTLVKHRCALPSARLHTALARGYAEVDPVTEELKNLDSQEIIPSSDSQAIFYLGKSPEERQDGLRQLLVSWHPDPARKDIGELKQHLQTIVKSRVTHVDSWIASNISRFQTDNADIRALKREFEKLSESLNANAQPCFMGCSLCRLPCLLIKSHESQNHDCNTLHRCPEICEFPDDHDRLSKKDETCVSLQYKGRCSGLLNPTHCC